MTRLTWLLIACVLTGIVVGGLNIAARGFAQLVIPEVMR